MGDHSKCAINTSFNTGTTVGVNCNIFGSGFSRNYIPSFSWGGSQGVQKYDFDKAVVVLSVIAWVVYAPAICSIISQLVLVNVPHVPAFSPVAIF